MKPHHWGILILTLLVLGSLAGYTLVQNGLFPLARVNGRFISLKTVEENVEVARLLYERGLVDETGSDQLFEKTLESLIINTVIRSRADETARAKASLRIESELTRANPNLAANVKAFYGWDLRRFRERVLEPQAIEEVLRQDLGEDGYAAWLDTARAEARVQIWFAPFEWKEGDLVRK